MSSRDLQRYEKSIKPLLKQTCFDCHSGNDVEGNFRADQLDPDLVNGADITWWLEVYSVISKEEMPPAESSELSDVDRALIVEWLSSEIQAAERSRTAGRKSSSFRRLTRYEYNYAMQDLLGVPWTFSEGLPDESSEEGAFENNADSLRISVKQVESYQRLAVNALERITVQGPQPATLHWSIPMKIAFEKRKRFEDKKIESAKNRWKDKPESRDKELKKLEKEFRVSADKSHYLDLSTGDRASVYWHHRKATNTTLHSDTHSPLPKPGKHFAVVQPGSRQALTVELDDDLPGKGVMRVRIRASRAKDVDKRIPSLQLSFGFKSTDQGAFVKRVSKRDIAIDASFGQPQIYQWDIPLSQIEHRNPYRGKSKPGGSPNSSEYIRFTNNTLPGIIADSNPSSARHSVDSESSAVVIEHIEVSAPFYEQWPPSSHRNVYIESQASENEADYAREIISGFMTRAWRRIPTEEELERKLRMFHGLRPAC